ncbi:Hypothetical predicted protein [Paramuricea clavata]|uniref:DUF1758 domain-containing protein n=1 Tax=Paramuricea clavata TaxID=317549 RepID=A0A6S7GBR6_PARCT|nr:Hypothetical predicted protein [Paramuricea clavata]
MAKDESTNKREKSRTAHRSYTRKLIHKAGEVCNNYDGTQPGEIKLEGLKRDLSEKLTILDKLDNSIIETVDEEKDIEGEINESSEFRRSIHEAISQIDLCLQEHKVKHNGGHDPNGSLSSSSMVNSSYSDGKQNVRLPKLNLKHFKGDPIKFQAFWDSFETTIHNNEDVSDVNKMSYLVSLLEGPAYSAVAGLSLTSANYKTEVDTLKERFGCEEVVISAHMDALLKLPGANTNSDTKKLRGIYDEVEQHVRGLKAVGISSKQYGKLLVPILMNKIPQELQLIITRKLGKEKWDLDALQNTFKEELEAREMCEFVTASRNNNKGKGPPDSPKSNPTATVFSDTEEGILLQTATAPVCNPRRPEKIVSARILFDSGSQKTYISKRLKDALGLSPLKSDRLIIKTFGTAGEMVKTCEEVQVSVQGNRDLNLYLTAHCVPIICAPLQNQRIEVAVREFPHLEGLELADSVHDKSELEVDLLVGSDFYWQFMTGRVQKGEAGPTAIESHLEWILSGPSSSVTC